MYKLKRLPKCGREAKQRSEQGERSAERHEPTLAIQSEAALGEDCKYYQSSLYFCIYTPLPPHLSTFLPDTPSPHILYLYSLIVSKTANYTKFYRMKYDKLFLLTKINFLRYYLCFLDMI